MYIIVNSSSCNGEQAGTYLYLYLVMRKLHALPYKLYFQLALLQLILPDSLKGRLCHTTNIVHNNYVHTKLVNFGGIEAITSPEDAHDPDSKWEPLADTTIVEHH